MPACVSIAERHGAVNKRLAINRDSERSAGLVLPAISPADGPFLVEEDVEVPLQVAVDLLGGFGHAVSLDKRENGGLDWRESGVERQHGTRLAADGVFMIRLAEERERPSIRAGGRFDHVWQVALLLLFVEVAEILAAVRLMLGEVVVAAVRDPFELADAEGELVLDVGGRGGVKREFVGVVVTEVELVGLQAEIGVPLKARVAPIFVPM